MYRNIIIFSAVFIIFIVGCENGSLSPQKKDNKIMAIGTYLNKNVDKKIWGDFQLVLELDKSKYLLNESILTKLYIKNIGNKTITLDGILPERSSANPPQLSIRTNSGKKFEIHKILYNLQNDNNIIIEPEKSIILMQIDFTNVNGFILYEDTSGVGYIAEELLNVYSIFEKGTYNIHASFYPTPQIYWSYTDTLTFTIE